MFKMDLPQDNLQLSRKSISVKCANIYIDKLMVCVKLILLSQYPDKNLND